MTRQNFYKCRRVRKAQAVDEGLLLSLVDRERALQPRLGVRKLGKLLSSELKKEGVAIGRDRFFEVMSRHGKLVARRGRSGRTTDSRHGLRVYGNLLKDMKVTGAHQGLVSDITYIRTLSGFMYLSLVMDVGSRAIVGWDCSDSLEMEGALRAVRMALKQLPKGHGAVHHSDRGSQYCSWEYVDLLKREGLRLSMTQENHCYENAKAERLNGILKGEYGLGETFADKCQVKAVVKEAVWLYNHRRPHTALGYQIPMAVHQKAVA